MIKRYYTLMYTSIYVFYLRYSPNPELFINLFRCVFIRLASLVLTAIALLDPVRCNYGAGCIDEIGEAITACDSSKKPENDEIYRACSNVNISDRYIIK